MSLVGAFVRDLRYAARGLLRNGSFTVAALLALTLARHRRLRRCVQRRGPHPAAGPQSHATLLGSFAALALLLAAIGLYGVMSYLVERRTAEIGVRMALGATPAAISRLVLGEAAKWTLSGVAAGMAASLWTARLIERMLFRTTPHDPATLALASAVLLGVALLAAWIPSYRAAGVDPLKALRGE
ncbi:MAG: FtsX-like permease family protein [Bryobacteraceae bacterium]|nr:FtsX-like permease family protein [Bryobacteraceae bacterium]